MLEKCFFDYYSITTSVPRGTLVDRIQSDIVGSQAERQESTPRFGYESAVKLIMPDLSVLCYAMFGGDSQNGRTLIYCSGGESGRLYRMLHRLSLNEVRVTRADVALDFDEPHAWESLHGLCRFLHDETGSKIRYIGPSFGELGDSDDGRTLYVGARTSSGMIRCYEKGKKDDATRPDWVRLELELKPQNPVSAADVFLLEPRDVFTTHSLGRLVADQLACKKGMPLSHSRIKSPPDYDRAFAFMMDQYGKTLVRKLRAMGGDIDALMAEIIERLPADA